MQVLLIFVSRFIGKENSIEQQERRYRSTHLVNFAGDRSDFFTKVVELPCLPRIDERYWLNFNPYFQSKPKEGFNNYRIEEIGWLEDGGGHIRPYVLWSEYEHESDFEEIQEEDRFDDEKTWEEFVLRRSARLHTNFARDGWFLDENLPPS